MCENLDVDLEAIACVHSLQYSTVQYSNSVYMCSFFQPQRRPFMCVVMLP